jgi:type III secretory pathway component EscR
MLKYITVGIALVTVGLAAWLTILQIQRQADIKKINTLKSNLKQSQNVVENYKSVIEQKNTLYKYQNESDTDFFKAYKHIKNLNNDEEILKELNN